MFRIFFITVVTVVLNFSAHPVFAEGFGALGDSLTDEYLGSGGLTETDLPALNWVQLLAQLRGIDFGELEMDASIRGEPRSKGYAFNWARAGATAGAAPFFMPAGTNITSQATGLAPYVTSGSVDIVFIGTGHNDYYYRDLMGGGFQTGIRPDLFVLDNPDYLAFEDTVFTMIFAAVDTILAAKTVNPAKIVIAKLPPDTLEGIDYIIPAMAQLNARIEAEVASRGENIKIVDLYDWGESRYDIYGNLLFGGYALSPDSKASLSQTVPAGTLGAGPCDSVGNCSSFVYTLNLVCHDVPGGHPGTIMQGLIANKVIEAVNPWMASTVTFLADEEIVDAAAPYCGTSPDTDTDGDGTADCYDGCPEDIDKTEPGRCDCGTPEGSCSTGSEGGSGSSTSSSGGGCFIKSLK